MNVIAMIEEMELNLMQLTKEKAAAEYELGKLDSRRAELTDFIGKTKADVEGLELAIEGLKSTGIFKVEIQTAEEINNETKESERDGLINAALENGVDLYVEEKEGGLKVTSVEPVLKVVDKQRGGYKKPTAVIMFGPDNQLRSRWSSMNKCAKDMGWTIARIQSMLRMGREVQLRRYGYFLATA